MRKRRGIKKVADAVAPASFWVLTSVGGMIVGLSKAPKAADSSGIGTAYNWAIDFAIVHKDWIVPTVAGALAMVAQVLKGKGQNRIDIVVKKLLNKFRDETFPEGDGYLTYRVTLFKHCTWHFGRFGVGTICNALFNREQRWRWPWSGWLKAYERAGDYHLDSKVCFYAPLGDVDRAEGFAGRLFRDRLALQVEDLPEVSDSANTKEKERWLGESGVQPGFLEDKLKRKKTIPRSFWGTYIEVDSASWGVLVVDSRAPKLPKNLNKSFGPTGTCLSQLLSKKSS